MIQRETDAAPPAGGAGMPPRNHIFLVRHGETEWNRLGLLQGTTDVPMNDAGRRQVLRLAETLRDVDPDVVYASPLRRARETAGLILARGPRPLVVLPELREMGYGLWQGKGATWRMRADPGLDRLWRTQPWRVRFPGGESFDRFGARVGAALDVIATPRGERRTVVVCSHGHVNRVLVLAALRWPLHRFWELEQPNGGCVLLEPTATGYRLIEVAEEPGPPSPAR